ncbi:hypothetical protein DVH24_026238 [Malus domestica]|uniref:Uncharacterized protein n=1 Tax=Malus domestica TaxID=3750 RepID=A0A498KN29_MALDO|nr:hypothetical protein DVH24_026238 [Malus domestica]
MVTVMAIGEATNKKKGSKTRGKNSDKLQEQLGGKKIPITLTKLKGKPTGPNSSFLVNDFGFVVQTYAPLNVKQWRNVEKKEVDKMIERIPEAKNGEQPSAIDCFEAVHTNIKNGWDEEAKLKWEEMIGMKNDTTPPYGTVILTDHEIVLEVVGHKSGYFKGPS